MEIAQDTSTYVQIGFSNNHKTPFNQLCCSQPSSTDWCVKEHLVNDDSTSVGLCIHETEAPYCGRHTEIRMREYHVLNMVRCFRKSGKQVRMTFKSTGMPCKGPRSLPAARSTPSLAASSNTQSSGATEMTALSLNPLWLCRSIWVSVFWTSSI
jgi:hypothetical protein